MMLKQNVPHMHNNKIIYALQYRHTRNTLLLITTWLTDLNDLQLSLLSPSDLIARERSSRGTPPPPVPLTRNKSEGCST